MYKKVLVAAVIVFVLPALIVAQDINFLFGGNLPEAGGTPGSSTQTVDLNTTSGSVNIYTTLGFDFDAWDLNFSSSDTSVARITGGEAFNPTTVIGERFDLSEFTVDLDGASGNLFSVRVIGTGISEAFAPFDPLVDADTPAGTGSFLHARVDYDIVGPGTAEFELSSGDQGFFALPSTILNPTFGSATLTVVPEPSSAILLMLSSAAMISRRRRV